MKTKGGKRIRLNSANPPGSGPGSAPGSGTLPWNPKLDQVVEASPGKIPKSSDQDQDQEDLDNPPADSSTSSKKDAVLGEDEVGNPLHHGLGKRKSRRNRKNKKSKNKKSRKSKTRKNGRKSNRRR
jgi:hypothetical protein